MEQTERMSLPPAAQGHAVQTLGYGSLAGAVVGACIGTALLYTVVLLVIIFTLALRRKRHRFVLIRQFMYLRYYRHVLIYVSLWFVDYREVHIQKKDKRTFELVEPSLHCCS